MSFNLLPKYDDTPLNDDSFCSIVFFLPQWADASSTAPFLQPEQMRVSAWSNDRPEAMFRDNPDGFCDYWEKNAAGDVTVCAYNAGSEAMGVQGNALTYLFVYDTAGQWLASIIVDLKDMLWEEALAQARSIQPQAIGSASVAATPGATPTATEPLASGQATSGQQPCQVGTTFQSMANVFGAKMDLTKPDEESGVADAIRYLGQSCFGVDDLVRDDPSTEAVEKTQGYVFTDDFQLIRNVESPAKTVQVEPVSQWEDGIMVVGVSKASERRDD